MLSITAYPFWGESTADQWISHQKGPVIPKGFPCDIVVILKKKYKFFSLFWKNLI